MTVSGKGPSTLVVIGSGCSQGLGVPTMMNFMDEVFNILSETEDNGSRTDLENIRAFIGLIKGSAASVQTSFLNIEELYGLADMMHDLGEDKELFRDSKLTEKKLGRHCMAAFNRAIYKIAVSAGIEFVQGKEFSEIASRLDYVKRDSQTENPVHSQRTRQTTLLSYLSLASYVDGNGFYPLVLQFNWDQAYDRALYCYTRDKTKCVDEWPDTIRDAKKLMKKHLPWYDYDMAEADKFDFKGSPLVLRPHGGISWVKPVKNGKLSTFQVSKKGDKWESEVLPDIIVPQPNLKIPKKYIEQIRIVPPTWKKDVSVFKRQWTILRKHLKDIRRIVFIGYSLPKSDLYFRHFMALALSRNDFAPKVYVCNPGIEAEEVRENYLDLFHPLAREGRLYGLAGYFGDPALFDLNRVFHLAKPIKP